MNRSWMFIPGDSDKKLGKAGSLGADALLLDLEDSVTQANKAAARERVGEYLTAHRGGRSPSIRTRTAT